MTKDERDERDDTNDSQSLTGGDTTMYRTIVARISYLSQDRPDLKLAAMQVCCAMAHPSVTDLERVKRIGRYLVEKPHWQESGELEAYSDATGGEKVTRRSVSTGVIIRGGHCLTKAQPWIVQLLKGMGYEFVGQSLKQEELSGMRCVGSLMDVKENAKNLSVPLKIRCRSAWTCRDFQL